jgi:putative transposase
MRWQVQGGTIMPGRPRIILPNVAVHLIQRGNNREPCFFHNQDYQVYLGWLHEYAIEARCDLNAYVLMTNHVHLLLTPKDLSSPGTLMKRLGHRYVQYINWTYQRSGTLWEGRYKSCIAQHEHYALSCYRYIELNPVRAKMVSHPADYRWSSYRANAQIESNRMLKPHESYLALG